MHQPANGGIGLAEESMDKMTLLSRALSPALFGVNIGESFPFFPFLVAFELCESWNH